MTGPKMRSNAFSPPRIEDTVCDGCGVALDKKRPWQRFCSDTCRTAWHAKQESGPAPDLRAILAENVRVIRARRQWSQEAVANAAGMQRSYIGDIERGKVSIGLDNLGKLAVALGVSAASLLEEKQ